MMNEKIFEAIGELDENLLVDVENVKSSRSNRVLRRALLVAALVAGLAVTAAAAPRFRSALRGGSAQTDHSDYFTPTDPQTGESHRQKRYEITLEVDFDQDAPREIEAYYMIERVSDGFMQYHGYVYEAAGLAQYGWIAEGNERSIYFTQQAGGAVATDDLTVDVYSSPDQAPEHGIREFAGIQGYLILAANQGNNGGEKIFYWSDGQYLFSLEVPGDFTDVELEQILSSIRPVTDITPYLCSMTDE